MSRSMFGFPLRVHQYLYVCSFKNTSTSELFTLHGEYLCSAGPDIYTAILGCPRYAKPKHLRSSRNP